MSADDVVRADTVVGLLERSRSIIHCGDGEGIELTTTELLERGRRVAAGLTDAGLQPGDRVAVQLSNGPRYLELLAACAVGRFVLMSVNTRFSTELATSLIERSGARMIVKGADHPPTASLPEVAAEPTATDRYVIFTTSGTTSAPKLVVHNQRSISVHGADVAVKFGYTPASTVMVANPLCGTFGLTTLAGALAGHSRVLLPAGFDAASVAAQVEEHGVTSLHGSDDMYHRLLAEGRDLSSITCAGYARFNSSLDGVVERADAAGVRLAGLYGMSEVQALFSFRDPAGDVAIRWPGGGTLTSPLAAHRVVDGELQLQGPSLFEGYLRDGGDEIDTELTDRHFDGPWFRTGDLAEDEGAGFRFLTRMGDVLRLGGFLVAPAEIEAVLTAVEGIEASQVVAVERSTGARPVAFVILDDAAPPTPFDEQAIIAHCQSHLAKFKSPVRVVPVDAFPTTDGPNGVKVQRARLREMADQLF